MHAFVARFVAPLVAFGVLAGCTAIGAGHGTTAHGPLHLVELSDPPGFNPLVTDNADVQDFTQFVHGFLLGVDENGNFQPDLVTEVPSLTNGGLARDGLTITYRLRKGVRWQDDEPFDARDVAFSFAAAQNPRNNVPDRSGFDDIASVKTPDAYTVVVTLKHPYSPALATFFSAGANDVYAILPQHLLARFPELNDVDYNQHPVGLGPYRVAKWERGSRVVLEADPGYRFGAPKIPRVEFAIVPDSNTALTLWQSGALDVMPVRGFAGSRALLQGAESVTGATHYQSNHYQFNYEMFNVAHPALSDVDVRRAIVQGVDRDRIERDVRGELSLPGEGDRLPGQFAYDASIHEPGYDPVAAAKSLDAAGWTLQNGVRMKDGKPLELEIVGVAGASGNARVNVQYQAALAKLGIKASIVNYNYAQLFASAQTGGILASGRFDLTDYGWQPGEDADHSYLFRCDTRPPNGENYGRICDPAIDAAAKTELESTDPAAQIAADRAMLRRINAQSYVLWRGFDHEELFARSDLLGIKPSVLGRHYWNIWTWSWKT